MNPGGDDFVATLHGSEGDFLTEAGSGASDKPDWCSRHVEDMCILYGLTSVVCSLRPDLMIEGGVSDGFSTQLTQRISWDLYTSSKAQSRLQLHHDLTINSVMTCPNI